MLSHDSGAPGLLARLGAGVYARVTAHDPWTNVLGLARTLLALGTAITFAFSDASVLFHPVSGMPDVPICGGPSQASLFCVAGPHLDLARWIGVAIALLVASGWRPRVTGVLHWWIVWSLHATASVVDGGDQVSAVLTLLLVPVTLCDGRRWHWSSEPDRARRSPALALVAWSGLVVARVQVAGIYFHAAIGKLGVEEWVDGTAVYYFFTGPMFGAAGLRPIVDPIVRSPMGVAALSWSTIMLELLLAASLFMHRRWARPLLVTGIVFHLGIAFVHGLVSFAIAMFAALVLLLRPKDEPFRWPSLARVADRVRTRFVAVHPAATVSLALFVALASTQGCYSGLAEDQRCARLQAEVDRLVAEGHAPAAVAAFDDADGECIVASGHAELGGAPLPTDASFRVGSITKSWVAVVALELAAEGRLDLDAPLADMTDVLTNGDEITMAELLRHTSGLPDYTASPEFWEPTLAGDRRWQPQELLAIAEGTAPIAAPGTMWSYSNSGYIAVGLAIEAATGRPLHVEIEERVTRPLGLEGTALDREGLALDLVRGYEWIDEGAVDVTHLVHPSGTWAAGAVVTTAADLRAFMRALATGEIVASARERAALVDWSATGHPRYPGYGMGLMTRTSTRGECIGHDGRMPGYGALAMYCPAIDASVVLLVDRNVADLDERFDAMLDAVAL